MRGNAVLTLLVACSLLLVSTSCARRNSSKAPVPASPARIGSQETGIASWYGEPYHGRKTASGETYNMHGFTAAHRKLPFHTWLKVRNLTNQQEVVVRINDRGPFVKGRIIDLSRRAAQEIQMIGPGTAKVRITVIKPPKRPPSIAGN